MVVVSENYCSGVRYTWSTTNTDSDGPTGGINLTRSSTHRTGTDDESDDGDWCVSLQLEFPSQRAFLVERTNRPSGEQGTGQHRDVMGTAPTIPVGCDDDDYCTRWFWSWFYSK